MFRKDDKGLLRSVNKEIKSEKKEKINMALLGQWFSIYKGRLTEKKNKKKRNRLREIFLWLWEKDFIN